MQGQQVQLLSELLAADFACGLEILLVNITMIPQILFRLGFMHLVLSVHQRCYQ